MKKRILIVEDSLTQRENLRIVLENKNYSLSPVNNGNEALKLINIENFDLVISDIIMPEMDGYTLCRKIKSSEATRNIPVMLLTSLSDPGDVIKGLQAGTDNFLTKPYSEEFLLSRVKYILINHEMRKSCHSSDIGLKIAFGGNEYFVNSDRMQIIDLLLSTYETAIQKNLELSKANNKLIQFNREMADKNAQLKKLNEEKNKYLRIAAHDIRNPAASVVTAVEFLHNLMINRINESESKYFSMISQSGFFILKLINDLLDIEVIETGNMDLNYEDIDLISLIQKVISLNQMFADSKSIKIHLEAADEKLWGKFDGTKIDQVMNNLLSNAIKYSYPEKDIFVKITREGKNVIVAVRDNGQGIPEEEHHKLFSPFVKTSIRGTAGEKSTGLGLSISKKIIETHNGEMWFESKHKAGSTFFFSLPGNSIAC